MEAGDDGYWNLQWLGQAFYCAQADTDAGKAAGAVDGNDGGQIFEGDACVVEQIGNGGDDGGGVRAAFEFEVAEDLDPRSDRSAQCHRPRWPAGIDSKEQQRRKPRRHRRNILAAFHIPTA